MRFIGLDVHLDFCEIAICEARARALWRSRPDQPAGAAAPGQQPRPGRSGGVGGDRQRAGDRADAGAACRAGRRGATKELRAITEAKVKTDRHDARTLARLLAAGLLHGCWLPDELTRALRRRLARRAQLVRQRTRAKNEVHAVLMRNLKGRPPMSDAFGARPRMAGRARAARRRARDRRWMPAPDRLPRRRDRDPRAGDRRARARLSRHQAADDRARGEPDHGGDVHRRRRRHPPLRRSAQARRLPRPGPQGPPVRKHARAPRSHLQSRVPRRCVRC